MSEDEFGVYRDVQDALRGAFAKVESGDDLQSVVNLIDDQVPEDAVRDWLLAARILANTALVVVEGWLRAPGVPRKIRRVLRGLLDRVVSEGLGERLTEERLQELHEDVDGRHVHKAEVVGPLLFVLEVLSMNTDPDIEAILLLT